MMLVIYLAAFVLDLLSAFALLLTLGRRLRIFKYLKDYCRGCSCMKLVVNSEECHSKIMRFELSCRYEILRCFRLLGVEWCVGVES